jgi:hypothetical protein
VLSSTDDSAKLWQRPSLRRWLIFALVGVIIAFSCALLLASQEAQAKAKQSPNQGSPNQGLGDKAKETTKPVHEATGEAARSAGNKEIGQREAGGKGAGERDVAAGGSTPRVDKTAPVDAEPARETARSAPDKTNSPVVDSALETAPPAAKRAEETLRGAAEPVRETVDPAVEPVLDRTASMSQPAVLDEVAPVVEPVLDKAISRVDPIVEPVLNDTPPVIEPVLNKEIPVIEPVLNETTSIAEPVVEPVDEAVEPAAWPPLEAAGLAVEPNLEVAASPQEPVLGATSPAVEPFTGASVPGIEPVFEMAAPVVEPGFGEENVLGSGELSASGRLVDALQASPSTITSHAPDVEAVEAWSTLPDSLPTPATSGETRSSSSHGSGSKTQPSKVGLLESRFGLFDRSPTIEGRHATLPGPTVAAYSQDQIPPAPFGFPSGVPPAGSSLGGSGPGAGGLDLLDILSSVLILSWIGGRSLWSYRESLKLDFSPQLAVERPG